jgi:hypothetical protein
MVRSDGGPNLKTYPILRLTAEMFKAQSDASQNAKTRSKKRKTALE